MNRIAATLCCLCMLVGTPVGASPKGKPTPATSPADRAEALVAEAKALFKAEQFDAAASKFMAAYAANKNPGNVYNAARAYQMAGKHRDALAMFRLYCKLTEDPDGLADAHQHIRELEAAEMPGESTATSAEPPTAPTPTSEISPVALWGSTGGAVLCLGAGAVLLGLGREASYDANARANPDTYQAEYASAQRQWTAGAVLTGIGAAAGLVAGWLHLRHAGVVQIAPQVRGGVTIAVRF